MFRGIIVDELVINLNNLSVFDQIINDYSSNYKCGDNGRNE